MNTIPPSVNFHLWKPCNLRCRFCYAVFDEEPDLQAVRGGLSERECFAILDALRDAGAEKLTFVGGEPTLCPHLPALLAHSRKLGLVNSIVTNGKRLREVLDAAPSTVDWVGLSVDSANEAVQAKLGRGRGDHVEHSLGHFQLLHSLGIRVKLNTVVTSLNWQENMSAFVREARPERWKIFQVLPIDGQNSGRVEDLLITTEQFRSFVERHRQLRIEGLRIAAETNDDMTGTYAMIDPLGRFFSNVDGRYMYSQKILDVGVNAAFAAVSIDRDRFIARGGVYEWGSPRIPLTISAK